MPITMGSGGVNRALKEVHIGDNGVNRKQKEIYVGSGGVNRKVFVDSPYPYSVNNPTRGQLYTLSSAKRPNKIQISGTFSLMAYGVNKIIFYDELGSLLLEFENTFMEPDEEVKFASWSARFITGASGQYQTAILGIRGSTITTTYTITVSDALHFANSNNSDTRILYNTGPMAIKSFILPSGNYDFCITNITLI